MNDTSRELLADYAHEAWSGWMSYLFTKCVREDDGTATMPAWAVARWTRQAATPYCDLPEEDKPLDRAEADRILAVLDGVEYRDLTQ